MTKGSLQNNLYIIACLFTGILRYDPHDIDFGYATAVAPWTEAKILRDNLNRLFRNRP
jgi:hypothetical protein